MMSSAAGGGLAAGQAVRQGRPARRGERPASEQGEATRPRARTRLAARLRGGDRRRAGRPRRRRRAAVPRPAPTPIAAAHGGSRRHGCCLPGGGIVPGRLASTAPRDHGEQPSPTASAPYLSCRREPIGRTVQRRTILRQGGQEGDRMAVGNWRVRVVVNRGFFDASELPARRWKDSYQDDPYRGGRVTNGRDRVGVARASLRRWCSKCSFDSDEQWEAFRALPAIRFGPRRARPTR